MMGLFENIYIRMTNALELNGLPWHGGGSRSQNPTLFVTPDQL